MSRTDTCCQGEREWDEIEPQPCAECGDAGLEPFCVTCGLMAKPSIFYITAHGASKVHAVAGRLGDLAPEDAWRKAETTICGRSLVPVNYLEDAGSYTSAGYMCQRCAAVAS